ncbi:aldose epimerase family protein [Oceaniglobus roseus]|uniref:aldose epimerase family protein n=1 Tax=Oceaniglobus roseus TaxID=1737570 RepID=UPI000C7F44A3|nr:aldose epimerase family protein [Kandeliimicrobium roseum]
MTPFGTRKDGGTVHRITLDNGILTAQILTHGAVLQDLRLAGVPYGLTLGATDIAAYEGDMAYYGAVVAPVVNRIAGAACEIDGTPRTFEANESANILHSGAAGSQNALWEVARHDSRSVELHLTQKAGEGGFPGTRRIAAAYALDGATLALTITATTDAPTLFNAAHHGYWNLDGTPDWSGHSLQIHADRYLPVNDATLPTGEIAPVEGTPFDLRRPRPVAPDDLPRLDHNFCLGDARGPLRTAVTLTGASGVKMEIATTEPGVQVFDAAPIDTKGLPTVHGRPYTAYCAFAIEPQAWPDAPHHPAFPSIALAPGETYRQHTEWRFSIA